MTLNRTSGLKPFSDKRRRQLADAGIDYPTSTFRPSTKPLKSPSSRKPALPVKQKKSLTERSGGYCEIGMTGCTNIAVDSAHRNGTRLGGRHGEAAVEHAVLSNVMHSCRSCHMWCHNNPAASKSEHVGWALEEWQNPLEWPVLYRGELSWLLDDGSVLSYEEACA